MGLNWSKNRARHLSNLARAAEYDTAAYIREFGMATHSAEHYAKPLKPGPIKLRCKCGHTGNVNTAKWHRFRCSQCDRLWIL